MWHSSKKRLLFISHESSISGAPILLLNLMKLLAETGRYEIIVVVRRGGPLDDQFIELTNAVILKPADYQKSKSFLGKVKDFIGYRARLKKVRNLARRADAIISNTITNGRLLRSIQNRKAKILTYVHELEDVIKIYDLHNDSSLSLELSSVFLVPAKVVANNLVTRHGIDSVRISNLNYYIQDVSLKSLEEREIKKARFFDQHGIPPGNFTVAGMGSATLRKGIDHFVEICRIATASHDDISFVWIGDFIEDDVREIITKKISDYRLEGKIQITGFLPNSPLNLLPFDVLALTSREDPYPLVTLEAAALSLPTICFSGSGGSEEFIGEDAGIIVPVGSHEAFAEAIYKLKNDPDLCRAKGDAARQKVLNRHSNPTVIISQFQKAIDGVA